MTQEIGNSELFDTWASAGGVTAPDSGKNDEGWLPAERPPFQIMNYLFNMQQQKINHILKNGIPQWNDTTEYLAGAVVIESAVAYRSTSTNTNSQPPSGNWEKLAPDAIKNTVAAADPTTSNDNTEGYETFSRWVNSASGEAFVCITAATGAAVWENATLTATDLGGAAFKGFLTDISGTVTNDDAAGALAIKNEIAAQVGTTTDQILHAQHQEAQGVDGGTVNNGSYNDREINQIVTNTIAGASLTGTTITLPAGTYNFYASGQAWAVEEHFLRLLNVDTSGQIARGQSAYARSGTPTQTLATIRGRFTIAGETDIRLEHFTEGAQTGNGLGQASNTAAQIEIFADIWIEKR